MKSYNKILIIQTAFIGDVVLTTPLIRAAKDCFPQALVDVLVNPSTQNLLENNPFINSLIIYDKRRAQKGIQNLWRLGKLLNQKKYDLVLSPHRSFRSAVLALLSRAKMRLAFHTSAGAFLYTHKIYYRRDLHEVERNLSLLEQHGCGKTGHKPELFPSDDDIKKATGFITAADWKDNETIVAMAPGSVWATKRWPKQYFIELAGTLAGSGAKILLIGGKSDHPLCQEIAFAVKNNILNATGQMSLLQSAVLIKRCCVLVSNDSGPQHLGVAVGTPVITIFGSTIPAFGFAPYGPGNSVVEIKLDCRPCGIHGRQKCPISTFECMRAIKPEQVLREINKLLPGKLSDKIEKNEVKF